MAKIFWLLCLVVLSACTYLPEITPATPAPCPTTAPCPTAAPCPAGCPQPTLLPFPTQTPILPSPVPTLTATALPAPTQAAPVEAVPTEAAPVETAWYFVEAGMPRLEGNFAHPELGCRWIGIGGQVLDAVGEAGQNRVVVVDGVYNGIHMDLVGLSGSAPLFGPAGFEIRLPEELSLSSRLFIQVYGLDGAPLSDPVAFTAPASCEQTLVMVNFRQRK